MTASRTDIRTRSRARRSSRVLLGLAIPVTVVVAWQLSTWLNLADPLFVPEPWGVAQAFFDRLIDGALITDTAISLRRAAIGFVVGGLLGVVIGFASGFSRLLSRALDPTLQLIRLTPTLAIAPLLVLWFGFGETSKTVLIASLAFFPLYMNAFAGVQSVSAKYVEVGKVLEFSRADRISLILLPAASPFLFNGLRLSLGVSWIGLIVAEITGSNSGIGYMIVSGQEQNRTELIFVGIFIFAVMGWLIDRGVNSLQRRVLRWEDSHQGR